MGWSCAVGVMQAAHRWIMLQPTSGAGLPPDKEVRKTKVMPGDDSGRVTAGWQVYLDNFATLAVEKRAELERTGKTVNSWHHLAREAWKHWGIPSSADKSVVQATCARELGC